MVRMNNNASRIGCGNKPAMVNATTAVSSNKKKAKMRFLVRVLISVLNNNAAARIKFYAKGFQAIVKEKHWVFTCPQPLS